MCNKIYILKCFLEIVKRQPCLHKFKSLHSQNCQKRFMHTYLFWVEKKAEKNLKKEIKIDKFL